MKDNKLVADFMDYENVDEMFPFDGELHYHTSWDWLMPVVSKITRDEQYIDNDYREHLLDIVPYGHIEDTYNAVVEFIKEYNRTTDYNKVTYYDEQ
jgi:hypothetical protein